MDPITLGLIRLGVYFFFKSSSGTSAGGFRNREKDGAWRVYFRGEQSSVSHVLRGSNAYYVCWDRPLRTEQDSRYVAPGAGWRSTDRSKGDNDNAQV